MSCDHSQVLSQELPDDLGFLVSRSSSSSGSSDTAEVSWIDLKDSDGDSTSTENSLLVKRTAYDDEVSQNGNSLILRDSEIAESSDNEINNFIQVRKIHKCGYGRFTPKVLQKFHNPKFLLLSLCFCSIVQGFVINGLVPISISTLEKRFHFTSAETGLFSSFYDISVLLALVPVCYFGNKGHKGTWCAGGMLLMGLGSFLCAVPQFATGPYQTNTSALSTICIPGNNTISDSDCNNNTEASSLRLYLFVLYAGQFLHGIGASPLYTLGVTYLDENVSQKSSPIYLSIFLASGTVGTALGFILGGLSLRIYGDIGKVDYVQWFGMTGPEDPRWYGAWWIGFILTGIAGILSCIPLFSFAEELPQKELNRLKDIDQANQKEFRAKKHKNEVLTNSLKHLHKHCWKLLMNPTYLCMALQQGVDTFLMNGFVTFVPKIMEHLFSLSSSKASMITGAITVPFGLAGSILGGYLIKKFNLKCAKIIQLTIGSSLMSLLMVFSFMIRCPETPMAGVNVGYENGANFSMSLINECNAACGCTNFYNPVCSPELGTSFYSPCHAGCTVQSDRETWSNCTCIGESNQLRIHSNFHNNSLEIIQGSCKLPCDKMPLFLVLFSMLTFFQFLLTMPVQQTILRSINFDQRSLAMGLQWIFIKALGSIPGPVCFGIAIDKTCILWKEGCGQQACLRYDATTLATVIMAFGFTVKIISTLFLFLAWKFYMPPLDTVAKEIIQLRQK